MSAAHLPILRINDANDGQIHELAGELTKIMATHAHRLGRYHSSQVNLRFQCACVPDLARITFASLSLSLSLLPFLSFSPSLFLILCHANDARHSPRLHRSETHPDEYEERMTAVICKCETLSMSVLK